MKNFDNFRYIIYRRIRTVFKENTEPPNLYKLGS